MKKRFYLVFILLITMIGCELYTINDQATINWINTHQKPIICTKSYTNLYNESVYTLQSVDNQFFSTGRVNLILPDTIHAVKIEDIMDTLMVTHSKENGFK